EPGRIRSPRAPPRVPRGGVFAPAGGAVSDGWCHVPVADPGRATDPVPAAGGGPAAAHHGRGGRPRAPGRHGRGGGLRPAPVVRRPGGRRRRAPGRGPGPPPVLHARLAAEPGGPPTRP